MAAEQKADPRRVSKIALALMGAGLFLAVFALRYAMIDNHLYTVRDDGVITMSTARNLIDFGFIGVSPSGPIVEASSSPLQTLVYAIFYGASGIDYASFSALQTYVTAALIGGIFVLFFAGPPARALTATAATAVLLTFLYPFFLWHGSGMENALTHLFFLASVYGVFSMDRAGRVSAAWIPVFALASMARMDSVVQISILLAAFSIYWLWVYRRLDAFWMSAGVGLVWAAVQVARYLYFGDILPNTAHAQEISVTDRLAAVASGDMEAIKSVLWVWAAQIVKHGWWLVLLALPFLPSLRLTPGLRAALVCLLVLGVMSFVTPLLFGRARIDVTRTTTQTTLLAVLALALIVFNSDLWARMNTRLRVALGAAAMIVAAGTLVVGPKPYYLGWHTSEMAAVRDRFVTLGQENGLPRPLAANHDLGVLSWQKSLNILDVGRLGSPVMAELASESERAEYMLDFAQPDMIATQFIWSEIFCDGLFRDPRFDALYVAVDDPGMTGAAYCDLEGPPRAFWIRRAILRGSGSFERVLIDRLREGGLSVGAFREALETCASPGDCRGAMHTAYRFMPELRAAGLADEVIALFEDEAERAYLSGWRDAEAHQTLIRLYSENM